MNWKTILRIIFLSMIAPLVGFLSRDNGPLDSLYTAGKIGDPSFVKWTLFAISILVPSGFYAIWAERSKQKAAKVIERRARIIQSITEVIKKALEDTIGTKNLGLNVRLWKRKDSRNKKIEFEIRNVAGLSQPGLTEGLVIEVSPNVQGVVGQCFTQKAIVIEEDSSIVDYKLNPYQKSKVNGTKFCLAIPIFDKKEKIVAIISFDTNLNVAVPLSKKNDILTITESYGVLLYETCTDLFK